VKLFIITGDNRHTYIAVKLIYASSDARMSPVIVMCITI